VSYLAARLLDAAAEMADRRGIDAVPVLQDAADPHGRRHRVLGDADAAARELALIALAGVAPFSATVWISRVALARWHESELGARR
jgi:hypothetical protein